MILITYVQNSKNCSEGETEEELVGGKAHQKHIVVTQSRKGQVTDQADEIIQITKEPIKIHN